MRKIIISFLLVLVSFINQSVVRVNANAESYTKVYVPLLYILSTNSSRMVEQQTLALANSPGIAGKHINLSAIPADRGVFSYVLYRLLYPEQQSPEISPELKAKYGYEKYSDKKFEPVMKDYTIWAIESGYLTPVGKANHLLGVKWSDIQSLLAALKIQPAEVDDYSIYDYEDWGYITDSEKITIGTFLAAFGRGIDTRSIERQKYMLTIADLVYLTAALTESSIIEIDDDELYGLTGFTFSSTQKFPLHNGSILSVGFPHIRSHLNKTVISDLKNWAKKEGFLFYEK